MFRQKMGNIYAVLPRFPGSRRKKKWHVQISTEPSCTLMAYFILPPSTEARGDTDRGTFAKRTHRTCSSLATLLLKPSAGHIRKDGACRDRKSVV